MRFEFAKVKRMDCKRGMKKRKPEGTEKPCKSEKKEKRKPWECLFILLDLIQRRKKGKRKLFSFGVVGPLKGGGKMSKKGGGRGCEGERIERGSISDGM